MRKPLKIIFLSKNFGILGIFEQRSQSVWQIVSIQPWEIDREPKTFET